MNIFLATVLLSAASAFAQSEDHSVEIAHMHDQCTSAMDSGLCAVALNPANYNDPRGYFIQRPGGGRWIQNSLIVGFSHLGFSKDPDGGWTMCNLIVEYCTADWEGDGCVLVKSKWRKE